MLLSLKDKKNNEKKNKQTIKKKNITSKQKQCKQKQLQLIIVRNSDQGCLGVYSQSNLLDWMLLLHSYQPFPQEFLTNIQYNEYTDISTDWGNIICDT